MAIHAITGVMGSGKSYEAVSEKLVPALRDSDTRRVVCNIEGLNVQAIADYINKPVEDVDARLVRVDYERVTKPGFWYDPEGTPAVLDSVVQPGDLVILDEVWRYFNRGVKLPEDAMRFFRMHRHYAHADSGDTCDVVLINQALRGIHQDIRDVVEVQFACRKLKALGRPQNYQVFVHEGGERKSSHSFLRKYRKEIFPLYSSYAHANAKESVDGRQNLLNKPFFKYVLPVCALAIVGGLYSTFTHFSNLGKSPSSSPEASAPAAAGPVAAPAKSASVPAAPGSPAPAPAPIPKNEWRLVSIYKYGAANVALVVNEAGIYRAAPVVELRGSTGADIAVKLNPTADGFITPFTGPPPQLRQQPVQGAAR